MEKRGEAGGELPSGLVPPGAPSSVATLMGLAQKSVNKTTSVIQMCFLVHFVASDLGSPKNLRSTTWIDFTIADVCLTFRNIENLHLHDVGNCYKPLEPNIEPRSLPC